MSDSARPKLPGDRPARRTASQQTNIGTWIGLLALLLGSGMFIGLTALVMPSLLGLVIVIVGAAFFFLLHYLTWGRWLMNRRRPPAHDDD